MDFKDPDSLNKAYELNGTDLSGYSLYVDEAKPRPDNNRDGGFSGALPGYTFQTDSWNWVQNYLGQELFRRINLYPFGVVFVVSA